MIVILASPTNPHGLNLPPEILEFLAGQHLQKAQPVSGKDPQPELDHLRLAPRAELIQLMQLVFHSASN